MTNRCDWLEFAYTLGGSIVCINETDQYCPG